MITRMDADIGRLMNRLKQSKIDDNTVIFFTSDNGPHKEGGVDPKFFNSSGSLRGIKRDLYEGGIRVPMIVRWPAKIKPGQISDFVWANWDFLPTAAEIAMTESPKDVDGFSVLPLLAGKTQTNRHDFLYCGFQQAARMGDWKAVRSQADQKLELYNLKSDRAEKENVAEKNPELVEKFEKYLKTARAESPRWPMKKPVEKAQEKRLPVSNARFAQVVGRHLHLDLVAHADADEVFAHLAGDVRQHFMAIGQGHTEHGARQHLRDRSGQLDWFFFRHVNVTWTASYLTGRRSKINSFPRAMAPTGWFIPSASQSAVLFSFSSAFPLLHTRAGGSIRPRLRNQTNPWNHDENNVQIRFCPRLPLSDPHGPRR
jgi:hypothetical protein